MNINIKATNYSVTPVIRQDLEEKFAGLNKYFDNIQQLDLEIGLTTTSQQKGKIFFCEANLSVPKKLLRYRSEEESLNRAINACKKGLQEEVKRYKEILA